MALRLREVGYPDAVALVGGFDAWRARGFPVEPLRSAPAENAASHQPM